MPLQIGQALELETILSQHVSHVLACPHGMKVKVPWLEADNTIFRLIWRALLNGLLMDHSDDFLVILFHCYIKCCLTFNILNDCRGIIFQKQVSDFCTSVFTVAPKLALTQTKVRRQNSTCVAFLG